MFSPFTQAQSIILASQSPRRKQLLEWAHIPFEIVVHPTDESFPSGLTPAEAATYIAQQKALAVVAQGYQNRLVLAADTIVVLGDQIIGKPRDRDDALAILSCLAGQTHEVITAVSMMKDARAVSFTDHTEVRFHPLTAEQLAFYVDTYQPYDKAGAYAIQEWIGVAGIAGIKGDFYNVMGLPVSRVIHAINTF